jgi:outer membrane protein
MKQLNFSIGLFFGLFLLALGLGACQSSGEKGESSPAAPAPAVAQAGNSGGPSVVFVYADTLLAKYEDFSTKQAELEKRQQQAESRIQSRMKALETEIISLQDKVRDMAPAQLAQEQERLGRREQEIVRERDRLGKELLDETQRLNKELEDKLNEVLKAIRQEYGYDFILSYGPGTGVLMANDSLDITDEVLRRLNEKK